MYENSNINSHNLAFYNKIRQTTLVIYFVGLVEILSVVEGF